MRQTVLYGQWAHSTEASIWEHSWNANGHYVANDFFETEFDILSSLYGKNEWIISQASWPNMFDWNEYKKPPKYLWSPSRNCNWIIEMLPKNAKWTQTIWQRIHWKSGTKCIQYHTMWEYSVLSIAHCFHICCTVKPYRMYERLQQSFHV